MQPTLRQTPPSIGQRSTSVTLRPRSAARNAAVYPPGPAPRTNNWVSRSCGTSGLSGFDGLGAASRRRARRGRRCGSRSRRRSWCGGWSCGGRRLGGRRGCLSALDARDQSTLGDLAALLHQHFGHGAGRRGRHVHRGLVSFERDQWRFDFDLVAHLDEHIDDGDLVEIAEIGNSQVDLAHDIAPTRSFALASVSARNLAMRAPIAPSMTR